MVWPVQYGIYQKSHILGFQSSQELSGQADDNSTMTQLPNM